MTEVMNRKKFLKICMDIEGLSAELYHFYSKNFEDIPEAALLWKKTALEEENHQKQFELALRLLDDTDFEVPEDSLMRAYSILEKLLKLLKHVQNNKPELLTAVSKAIEMEEKLADLHVHTTLIFMEESMHKMFMALNKADVGHDLQRYRMILNLPHTEMEG